MAQLLNHLDPGCQILRPVSLWRSPLYFTFSRFALRSRSRSLASSSDVGVDIEKFSCKQSICTADELHFVTTSKRDWRLALWRYIPPPVAPIRNHPLLLLSGVGTNAIGYDLSPESSFARYMSSQGFDTWILEFRGAGLSCEVPEVKETSKLVTDDTLVNIKAATDTKLNEGMLIDQSFSTDDRRLVNLTERGESKLVLKLTETLMWLCERFSGFMNENQLNIICMKLFDQISKLLGDSQLYDVFYEFRVKLLNLLESKQNFRIGSQIREFSQGLVNAIIEGQRSLSPQVFDLHDRFTTTIEEFQKQIELMVKYDWDFDHYLEEDVPHAVEYIRNLCKPDDGRLFAIGHSMGGILLYAMLSHSDHGLAAVVTLGSALDYSSSNSSLKFLLPLADPVQALNVPAVPLGAIMAAAYPLSSHPPYLLSSLNALISAEGMMHPDLFKKLVLNNFGTIPAKLILQLTSAFKDGGLTDRSGTFFYKDHLHSCNIPVLALAGDHDLICPPLAVHETAKMIPEHLVEYREFGRPEGPHYGHYDLVGGRLAVAEVCPHIIRFLGPHDGTSEI